MQVRYEVLGAQAVSLSIERYISHLAQMPVLMSEAAEIVYKATEQWFNSRGEGTWPELAESTIARKASQGAAEPARPLYMEGNLYESVISRSGPYSWYMPMLNGVAFGVNWKPAEYLSEGVQGRAIHGVSAIPARPIWPPATSGIGLAMTKEIGLLLLRGSGPAFPGARMGRGAGGRFVSLR